jgi:hypothetical protein
MTAIPNEDAAVEAAAKETRPLSFNALTMDEHRDIVRKAFDAGWDWYAKMHPDRSAYPIIAGEGVRQVAELTERLATAKFGIEALEGDLAALAAPPPQQHPDDAAVDRFAAAMKAKLAKKRSEGRGGWEDKEQCSAEFISGLLHDHVAKGDPIDVANLAMMLHQRGERITHPRPTPAAAVIEARLKTIAEVAANIESLAAMCIPGDTRDAISRLAVIEADAARIGRLANAKQEGE